MARTKLKVISVYVTEEEYEDIKQKAENETSMSNIVRYLLNLPVIKHGPPIENKNRLGKKKVISNGQQ